MFLFIFPFIRNPTKKIEHHLRSSNKVLTRLNLITENGYDIKYHKLFLLTYFFFFT